jgi:hypothetical protein
MTDPWPNITLLCWRIPGAREDGGATLPDTLTQVDSTRHQWLTKAQPSLTAAMKVAVEVGESAAQHVIG